MNLCENVAPDIDHDNETRREKGRRQRESTSKISGQETALTKDVLRAEGEKLVGKAGIQTIAESEPSFSLFPCLTAPLSSPQTNLVHPHQVTTPPISYNRFLFAQSRLALVSPSTSKFSTKSGTSSSSSSSSAAPPALAGLC
jgi:hypothetical protein